MSKLYGSVSLWHYFAENVRTTVMKRHCHNSRDKLCRHYESKTGFCMGKLRGKWLKRGAFPRHIPVLLTKGNAPPPPPGEYFLGRSNISQVKQQIFVSSFYKTKYIATEYGRYGILWTWTIADMDCDWHRLWLRWTMIDMSESQSVIGSSVFTK